MIEYVGYENAQGQDWDGIFATKKLPHDKTLHISISLLCVLF